MNNNVYLNNSIEKIVATKNKKIIFIHVGKCAGSTIMRQLRSRLPVYVDIHEMHCYNSNEIIRDLVNANLKDAIFLVTLRDPISRFISAYNWDRHNLYLQNHLKDVNTIRNFKEFFPLDYFMDAIVSDDEKLRERAVKFSKFGHMGMGQSWYTPMKVAKSLPCDRTYICEPKNIKRDLNILLSDLNVEPIGADVELPKVRGDYDIYYKNPDELFSREMSKYSEGILRRYLKDDFDVFSFLKDSFNRCAVPTSGGLD